MQIKDLQDGLSTARSASSKQAEAVDDVIYWRRLPFPEKHDLSHADIFPIQTRHILFAVPCLLSLSAAELHCISRSVVLSLSTWRS